MNKRLAIFFYLFFIFKSVSNSFAAETNLVEPVNFARLNDIYFENIRLSNADTFVSYTQMRSGLSSSLGKFESYAVLRAAMDTRTVWGSTSEVYNDNFFFAGVGLDYLGLAQGLRLTAQVGGSVDLDSKIHQGGFDYRVGTQSYHELQWAMSGLKNEIYSEALYLRRYSNFLAAVQLRTFYTLGISKVAGQVLRWGPLVNLVGSLDSQGLDYNRFTELRLGARWTWEGPFSLSLSPYYVLGGRWARPTDLASYQDFRVLLSGGVSL